MTTCNLHKNHPTKLFNQENNNLFKVGDNYMCVSDERIDTGDWFHYKEDNSINNVESSLHFTKLKADKASKKIIFSTQFIDESIPVLDIESEDIEKLSLNFANSLKLYAPIEEHEFQNAKEWFRFGYQKAKEKYQFTEEDLEMAFNHQTEFNQACEPVGIITFEQFIQSLQQPKQIKSIEVEYEYTVCGNKLSHANSHITPSLTPVILPNGKVKCKLNY